MLYNGSRRLSGRETTFKVLRYGMVGISLHVSLQYHSAWEIHRSDYEGIDHLDMHLTECSTLLVHSLNRGFVYEAGVLTYPSNVLYGLSLIHI